MSNRRQFQASTARLCRHIRRSRYNKAIPLPLLTQHAIQQARIATYATHAIQQSRERRRPQAVPTHDTGAGEDNEIEKM
jgi:hypothetical protein